MIMKEVLFLWLLSAFVYPLRAQQFNESENTGYRIINIPDTEAASTAGVARYVNAHFAGDRNKFRAIYTWVVSNIKYDKDSANIINAKGDPLERITIAMRRKRGVCDNFAAIFNDISSKAGLMCAVVTGYTRQSGIVDKTGHSWCAVRVDNEWYLCDPTWDVGNSMQPGYFMVSPAEFIESHMPFDPMWQLLHYPVSHEQFYGGNFYRAGYTSYFNFPDSIFAYNRMDSLHKLQSAALRIQNEGIYNARVRDQYNYVKMHIEMINQQEEVDLYNASVADLNDATAILNHFIEYRNNQFMPAKTDVELLSLLNGIDRRIDSSLVKLGAIDNSKATLTLGTADIRARLEVLQEKTKAQQAFLDQYLNTTPASRKSLFY
jgi:Transglutaminase-like superfamily